MENKKKISRKSKAGQRQTTCRACAVKDEEIPGFCPMCSKPVGIIVSENATDVFGICPECGNTLFFAHKAHKSPILIMDADAMFGLE
jgi:hypothetical protein